MTATKKILLGLVLFSFISCKSQSQTLTFKTLKNDLIDFMVKNKDISTDDAIQYKNGNYNTFILRGYYNELSEGKLINGLYAFATLNSNTRAYSVIVENNNYIILDLSTRQGLDKAIIDILNFGERNDYCINITNEYITRVTWVYYSLNKNRLAGRDVNCERGIKDKKSLP